MKKEIELNLDGLVGPTHLFQGLSFGNIASMENQGILSSPKKAALQGLEKMWFLKKLGVRQGILPPQNRPHIPFLRRAGFSGSDKDVLKKALTEAPALLAIASSSSSMWAANSATVSKKGDMIHITPANLSFMPHRSLEKEETTRFLKLIFQDPKTFIHHESLPNNLPDEGAANHMRLHFKDKSLELFIFGRTLLEKREMIYPARHPLETSQAIYRLHTLEKALFIRQSEEAISAGAFHNDVVATSFEDLLLFHENSFSEKERVLDEISEKAPYVTFFEVKERDLSLKTAIATYFFNSQIVRTDKNERLFLAPKECEANKEAVFLLDKLMRENLIDKIAFVPLSESMQNGGGPACLRLRVPMSLKIFEKVNPSFLLTEKLYFELQQVIETDFRETLTLQEIPEAFEEFQKALKKISRIMGYSL
jgi:succinylarginine dihydrolase